VPQFADWCAVDLVEPDNSLRRLAVVHVDAAKVALAQEFNHRYPPDPNALHGLPQVLRTGESDMMTEITDDLLVQGASDEEHLRILRELGFRSYMCVPLKGRSRILGVVTFVSAESERRYTKEDLVFAEELARRSAIAIENAQLYLELREADRRKDEFLATLAHELRNPLAPIRNALQVLKMPSLDESIAQQSKEMIERQVHHLVRLVDDLLDVSRVMRGKTELRKETVELSSIVARAVETAQPLIDAQEHKLTITLPTDSLLLNADPVRLTQVIGNMLTNAAKYSEPNGCIWLKAQREGDEAVLSVRDTGIGIAPEMLPHIFELFVQVDYAATRSQGGLGIGLTLVKNLVEMHLGTIEARSEGLGKGSEFVMRLPLTTLKRKEPSGQENSEQQPGTTSFGHRLLVVDDNKDAATSLAMLLKLQGHEVRMAHNGSDALEIVTDYQPDMIFLDIGMPGMDGFEVARRIRRQPGSKRIELVALTGWGQQEDRRRSAEAGFDHHIVKPPDRALLAKLLARLKSPNA
jgi:signal transduction histidine kinase